MDKSYRPFSRLPIFSLMYGRIIDDVFFCAVVKTIYLKKSSRVLCNRKCPWCNTPANTREVSLDIEWWTSFQIRIVWWRTCFTKITWKYLSINSYQIYAIVTRKMKQLKAWRQSKWLWNYSRSNGNISYWDETICKVFTWFFKNKFRTA